MMIFLIVIFVQIFFNVIILVFYYLCYGVICKLVELIVQGVESVFGCDVCLCIVLVVFIVIEVVELDVLSFGVFYVEVSDLVECDGLVLGLFMCFGNMVVVMKYFWDGILLQWFFGVLVGKLVCVFIFIGSLYGGQELMLLSMMLFLLYYGMLIVGLFYLYFELMNIFSGGMFYGVSYWVGVNGNQLLLDDLCILVIVLGKWLVENVIKLWRLL